MYLNYEKIPILYFVFDTPQTSKVDRGVKGGVSMAPVACPPMYTERTLRVRVYTAFAVQRIMRPSIDRQISSDRFIE